MPRLYVRKRPQRALDIVNGLEVPRGDEPRTEWISRPIAKRNEIRDVWHDPRPAVELARKLVEVDRRNADDINTAQHLARQPRARQVLATITAIVDDHRFVVQPGHQYGGHRRTKE